MFYSENTGFYKYYKTTIEYILSNTNITVHYITSDPNDIVFELAKEQPKLKPYYIGEKKLITLMMKMDADVVVVGAGAAGLSAALKTAQNGHSIILLEKMGVIGGASAMAGSGTMATGSKWQKEDGYEDSAEKLVEDMMANGHQKNDRATVELFANTIGEAFDWLVGEDGAAVPYQHQQGA